MSHFLSETVPTFGQLVRQKRNERGMSLFQLAVLSGIGLQTICNMENGKGGTLSKAMRLASCLGIDAIPVQTSELVNQKS